MRVWTMKLIRFVFVGVMATQVIVSLLGDRATFRPGNLRRSWRRFRRSPLVQPSLWAQLRDYDRPDFHPDDRDTNELVARWRDELFGDHGTLNDKLARPAA
jgi:predicted metal-dependent hydrolase